MREAVFIQNCENGINVFCMSIIYSMGNNNYDYIGVPFTNKIIKGSFKRYNSPKYIIHGRKNISFVKKFLDENEIKYETISSEEFEAMFIMQGIIE